MAKEWKSRDWKLSFLVISSSFQHHFDIVVSLCSIWSGTSRVSHNIQPFDIFDTFDITQIWSVSIRHGDHTRDVIGRTKNNYNNRISSVQSYRAEYRRLVLTLLPVPSCQPASNRWPRSLWLWELSTSCK